MPVRILHVVESLGVGGGVENGIANLIERMDPARFEHVLCAVFRVGSQLERYPSSRVPLIGLAQQQRRFSTQVYPLVETIRKVNPDVVHSRNWGALESVFAGRWAGSCSVVHSEHGVETDPLSEPRRRRYVRRTAYHFAHHVFAVSDHLRQTLARTTGFSSRSMGVIRNGVETARFSPDGSARHQFRTELGISDEEFCIGCVGRLNAIKDYPTMLRAADLFSRFGRSWRLLIAGSGAEMESLQALVQSMPSLHRRVHFLGSVSRVPEFLQSLDLYVLTSTCEGISNSLLEAMATRLPVIASDTGGNPEVVIDGESGLLFPPGDFRRLCELMCLVYADPERRARLAERALQRVRTHFSLEAMVRKYEELYISLAGSGASRQAGQPKVAMSCGELN